MRIAERFTTAKGRRLSIVAVSGAAMALSWSILDAMLSSPIPSAVTASTTALALLLAGFADVKAEDQGLELYTGEEEAE